MDAFRRCLEAIPSAELAAAGAEVVLVDNGSRDQTAGVAGEWVRSAPCRARLVREEEPGLSRARNAGLRAARGGIVAFTDDDCRLRSGYPGAVRDAFAGGSFDWCGGRILPFDDRAARYGILESVVPRIFPPRSFVPAGAVQGANMAFRREVIERVGEFDTMLGAGTPFRCEDVDYCARASLAGFAGAYVPEIVVLHDHGRRRGEGLDEIEVGNDHARGAYYAKLRMLGASSFLGWWAVRALRPWRVAATARELGGAVRFARECGRRGIRPTVHLPGGSDA
jgi:GT2 family glycosyltransferase